MGKQAGEGEMAEWRLSSRETAHRHCKGAQPLPPKQATRSCREPSTTSAQPSGEPMPTGLPGHARAQARSLTLPQPARSFVPTRETDQHARRNNTPFVHLIWNFKTKSTSSFLLKRRKVSVSYGNRASKNNLSDQKNIKNCKGQYSKDRRCQNWDCPFNSRGSGQYKWKTDSVPCWQRTGFSGSSFPLPFFFFLFRERKEEREEN